MEKLSYYEKILQVIEAKGITIPQAEGMAGLGATTIDKLKKRKNGKGKLHKDNLEKFLRTFHVARSWWNTGEGPMFEETAINSPIDLNQLLLESLRGINKLIDENSQFIKDKRDEVARLERQNIWANTQIDKLTSKLGVPKEAQ